MLKKIKDHIRRLFSNQFVRFVFVAGLNTAFGLFVNYVFLFIFEHLLKINHAYVISNFLATIVSILFNFKTYGALVFKNKDNKLIFKFLMVTAFTYLMNIGGIALLEHLGSANNYINLTVMAVPVGLCNYFFNKIFTYTENTKPWQWLMMVLLLLLSGAICLLVML